MSILADIVDEQNYETRQRQEGVAFAALMFSTKAFSGVGTLLGGWVLDFIQFDVNATPGEAPPEVLFKLGLFVGPILGCLLFVPFTASRFFTVSLAKHAEIKETLLKRQQETSSPMSEHT